MRTRSAWLSVLLAPIAAVATLGATAPTASASVTERVLVEKGGYAPNYVAIHTGDAVRFVDGAGAYRVVAFHPATGIACVPAHVDLHPGGAALCRFEKPGTFSFDDPGIAGPTYRGTIVVHPATVPAAFTTASSTTFVTGTATTFAVHASGLPAPTVSLSGTLPAGLSFVGTGDGSAVISGSATGPAGTAQVTLLAGNGVGPVAEQVLTITVAQPPAPGYVAAEASGVAFGYGQSHASSPVPVNTAVRPIVAVSRSPGDLGYYLVTSRGGVYNLGGAPYFGSAATRHLPAPISAFATTPDGRGYWLVARDGTVYPFGDATAYSSLAVDPTTRPIVGIGSTPDGRGYWLVSSRGNVYNYGDAGFYGSAATFRLAHPVVAFGPSSDGKGYWLTTSAGNIYNYGDAGFYGSEADVRLAHPVVAMQPTLDDRGYYVATSAGSVYEHGDALFYGSPAHSRSSGRTVGIAIPD